MLRRYSHEYQMQEILKQIEPQRKILEMLERTSISKQVQDMLDRNSIASQAQKMMEQYFPKNLSGMSDEVWRRVTGQDSISNAMKQYEQYLKPMSQQREWLDKLQRQAFGGLSLQDFARQIEQASPAIAAMEAAKQSLDGLFEKFRDIDFSQFEVGEEDEREIERAAVSIGISATGEATLQGAVDQIIGAIQTQQQPKVQLMLWLFFRKVLDWLIAGAIGAAMGYYAPAILGESPQAAKKAVREIAREGIGTPELLMEYRYVSAKMLIVRQNPRARSPEVGRLTFGKPVKLLTKDKDFVLVLWTDKESGVEVQGWVFARYLAKFN